MDTKYTELRAKVKSGDTLLCKGKGFFSRIIKWRTKSDYSHVAFIIRFDEIDRVFVLESVEGVGVRMVPLSFYLGYKGNVEIWRDSRFPKPEVDEDYHLKLKEMTHFATGKLGVKYDKMEIVRIASRLTFKYRHKHKDNEIYICSEYHDINMQKMGVFFGFNIKGYIAPGDIAKDIHLEKVGDLK